MKRHILRTLLAFLSISVFAPIGLTGCFSRKTSTSRPSTSAPTSVSPAAVPVAKAASSAVTPTSKSASGIVSAAVNPPKSQAPESGATHVLWDEALGACLDQNQRPAYNPQPTGTDSQCVDYSNQDLTEKNFSGYDLRGSNFRNAVLVGVKLDAHTLIKGLALTNAEVDNSCMLLWLTTGTMPPAMKGASPCSTSSQAVSHSLIVSADPTAIQPNVGSQATQALSSFGNVAGIKNHFSRVAQDSNWGVLGTKVELASLGMQRHIDQSLARITAQKMSEDDSELKASVRYGDTFSAPNGASQVQLTSDTSAHQSYDEAVSTLIASINTKTQTYKKYEDLYARANRIANLTQKGDAKENSFNQRLESHENFSATVDSLASSKKNVQNLISSLTASHKTFNQSVTGIKAQIQTLTTNKDSLDKKISLANQSLETLSDGGSNKSTSARVVAIQQTIETLRSQRNQVAGQIAQLRSQLAQPERQLATVDAQISAVKEELDDLGNQIDEANLLDGLAHFIKIR